MRLQRVLLALLLCLGAAAPALGHHRHITFHERFAAYEDRVVTVAQRFANEHRPSRWCGWFARFNFAPQDPGPAYNLARNWAHWGRPAWGPAPGVIGVLPHHVFKVIAMLDRGQVLAISGNDGHAVRTRPRSIAGVIAWRVP
jgi:hypothetical protein